MTDLNKSETGLASEDRREFLKKAVKVGYMVPLVATFTMSGLMGRPQAAHSNMGHSG